MKSKYFEHIKLINDMLEQGHSFEEIVQSLRLRGVSRASVSTLSEYMGRHKEDFTTARPKKRKKQKGLCDARCKTCIYHTTLGIGEKITACFYNARTGKSKWCPGGAECTQYIKGSNKVWKKSLD